MLWNDHSKLMGLHAFLGASNFHWINWNDEIFEQRYYNQFASQVGVIAHEVAKDCIQSRIRLTKHDRRIIDLAMYRGGIPKNAFDSEVILTNLMTYVNDAIGYHMTPEVILYYSGWCFGTSDAICFNEKQKILRIHDLKNGKVPAKIEQLLIYAALFCLEYRKNPNEFKTELRIYQNFEVLIHTPEPVEIEKFMVMIRSRNDIIKNYLERDV
jgi:uncharacterized protein (DUF779 family)